MRQLITKRRVTVYRPTGDNKKRKKEQNEHFKNQQRKSRTS